MKNEEIQPPKHVLEHELPVVIHHDEENRTLLAQWFDNYHKNPAKFWGVVGPIVAVIVALGFFGSGYSLSGVNSDAAWTKLETAKTAAERVEIAKEFPKTNAERWALIQAATEYFNQGFSDLPQNKDVALPTLKKALDLFQKVVDEAPKDSSQARLAAIGVARTHEARGDLQKAIAQSEKVAETKEWAGTTEATEAGRLATLLKRPESEAFYKELLAYKPVDVTLPAGGIGDLKLPFPNLNGTKGDKPKSFLPDLGNLPPPPPTPATGEKMPDLVIPTAEAPKVEAPAATKPGAELPADVFTPKTEAPKVEAPKAEAPKASTDIPADVFAPSAPK